MMFDALKMLVRLKLDDSFKIYVENNIILRGKRSVKQTHSLSLPLSFFHSHTHTHTNTHTHTHTHTHTLSVCRENRNGKVEKMKTSFLKTVSSISGGVEGVSTIPSFFIIKKCGKIFTNTKGAK